jgi:hypothetical protein
MLFAVEEGSGFEDLRVVVRAYVDQGMSVLLIMEDLEQIRGLLAEEQEDHVLDVMDLVVGYCLSGVRIGPYAWGDPRNEYRNRFRETEGPEATRREEG